MGARKKLRQRERNARRASNPLVRLRRLQDGQSSTEPVLPARELSDDERLQGVIPRPRKRR